MRKPRIAFTLIVLIVLAQLIATSPVRKSLRRQLNPNYVRAMAAYRKLERKIPHEELRAITIIGILNGAKQTEAHMEKHLIEVVKDLVEMSQAHADDDSLKTKIYEIEQQLSRDQSAMEILTASMDMAMKKKNSTEFQREMQKMLQALRQQKPVRDLLIEDNPDEITQKVNTLRHNIVEQVTAMRKLLEDKIENTLDYLIDEADDDGLLAKASNKVLRKRAVDEEPETTAEVKMIKSILNQQDFRDNLIEGDYVKRASNTDDFDDDELSLDDNSKKVSSTTTTTTATTTAVSTTTTNATKGKQEFAESMESMNSDGDGGGGGGGGLVGLIGSLSGGEGGSDLGALIGALTGVISTLFGPGGLDIESLIGTASSLISGLLSGNKNFGTVLGVYVGTLFDGISGGGGAINNGQFFGNFLGTVYASLSADPEDDDLPARPLLFAQNLISSFMEAKNRKASDEETSSERKDNKNGNGNKDKEGGSDSGAFIKHIVSHLVSNALSVILNASLGASGGASHASHSLFAHSSAHKSGGSGGGGGAKY